MLQLVLGTFLLLAAAQSINFFSPKQDVEIGSESAKAAEQTVSLVAKTALPGRHLNDVALRVVQNRSLPALKYQFHIVNSKDINSVGFPGGSIYINRGLLEIAANDDEVAAMVAHEVSHVASRHGTVQLSRQLLVQAPIAIAAGVPASQVWKDEIAKLGIPLGMEAPFLRYSREQELEASLMAIRLLADARFDPDAFRTLLEKINEAQTSDAPRPLGFVFNHPQSQILPLEISEQLGQLAASTVRARAGAEFRAFHTALLKLPPPAARPTAEVEPDAALGALPNVFTHSMDYFRLSYPDGWQVIRTGPNGAMIAPATGVLTSRVNGEDLTHGAMFDLFDIAGADRSFTLEQATNRLIVFLSQRNPSLRIVPGAQTQTLVSDEPGLRSVLIGKSDSTGKPEVAWVVTRMYYQNLFYMVLVAPEDEFPVYQPVFEQIIRSVRFR